MDKAKKHRAVVGARVTVYAHTGAGSPLRSRDFLSAPGRDAGAEAAAYFRLEQGDPAAPLAHVKIDSLYGPEEDR